MENTIRFQFSIAEKIMQKSKYSKYCKQVAKRSKGNHINYFYLVSYLSLSDYVICSFIFTIKLV